MPTPSVWSTLFVQTGKGIEHFSLHGRLVQLRADADRFALWVWPEGSVDRDDEHERELILHGARLVSLSDHDVTYEGWLDESPGPFGNKDGSQTMRRVTVLLAVAPVEAEGADGTGDEGQPRAT